MNLSFGLCVCVCVCVCVCICGVRVYVRVRLRAEEADGGVVKNKVRKARMIYKHRYGICIYSYVNTLHITRI